MNCSLALRTCLTTKVLNITDRASRSEFWWFTLFVAPINLLLNYWYANYLASPSKFFMLVMGPISLFVIVSWFTVGCRRFHDMGINGLWSCIGICSFLFILYIPSFWEIGMEYTDMDELTLLFLLIAGFCTAGVVSIVFIVLYATLGTIGPNQYGPDPIPYHLPNFPFNCQQNSAYPYPNAASIPNSSPSQPSQIQGVNVHAPSAPMAAATFAPRGSSPSNPMTASPYAPTGDLNQPAFPNMPAHQNQITNQNMAAYQNAALPQSYASQAPNVGQFALPQTPGSLSELHTNGSSPMSQPIPQTLNQSIPMLNEWLDEKDIPVSTLSADELSQMGFIPVEPISPLDSTPNNANLAPKAQSAASPR